MIKNIINFPVILLINILNLGAKNVTVKQKTIEKLKQIFDSRNKYDHCGICKTPFISMFLETGTLLPEQKIDCKPVGNTKLNYLNPS